MGTDELEGVDGTGASTWEGERRRSGIMKSVFGVKIFHVIRIPFV